MRISSVLTPIQKPQTFGGGPSHNCSGFDGCGTVYSISRKGVETVLHDFTGPDGSEPAAPLLRLNGTLYGTTQFGGANNDGTVFSLMP